MFTDYKWWYIKRDDNDFITEVAVRFFEGEYKIIDGKEKYVRTRRLETITDLAHLVLQIDGQEVLKGVTEQTGEKAVFYTQEDFGQIKTDDELRTFLNKEIAKDKGRQVINEQKI